MVWVASLAFWGVSWDLFRTLWGRLGASRGHIKELLGPPLAILGGILGGQAPKMPPRKPKEPPKAPKTLPKGLQKTSQTSPRAFLEAPNGFQERVKKTTD